MSHSPDQVDLHRRAATYIDKILKGSKPADLPVEQASQYQLIVNLKTAKALGLTVPPAVLVVLRHEFRRRFPVARGIAQQGHRGNARAMPAMRRRRMLAMELATCRSGRSGGASGSVTRG